MKKVLLLIFLVILSFSTAHSQALLLLIFGKDINIPHTSFGAQLGVNASFLTNSGSTNPFFGYSLGAYSEVKLKNKLNLVNFIAFKFNGGSKDVLVTQKDVEGIDTNLLNKEVTRKMSYFNLAPIIQYNITHSFSIGLGPYISILTNNKDMFDTTMAGGEVHYVHKNKNLIKLFDAGLAFDIQYAFRKGNGLRINLRYTQGFINIYKSSEMPFTWNSIISAGVGIPITSKAKKIEEQEKK